MDIFTYGHSIRYKMLLVRLHVYRSIKIKAYKLFENNEANLCTTFCDNSSSVWYIEWNIQINIKGEQRYQFLNPGINSFICIIQNLTS